jgi:TRAP-type uncharacterized transport system substrate-binding protein
MMRDFCFGPAVRRLALSGLALVGPAVLGQDVAGPDLAQWAGVAPAAAQQIPKSLQEGGRDDPLRKRQSGWTVSIAAGGRDDTSMRFADELGRALNDGDDLRVLPIASRGPAGNVEDLLSLHDIDIAVTQADALEYFRVERKMPLGSRIQYIAELPAAEVHVAAREGVHVLEELRGQKVVFGPAGGAAATTGPIMFRRLGIAVKPVFTDLPAGLDLVKSGEAAAILTVDSKPSDFWVRVPPYAGLHFVPAPHGKAVADLYAPDVLTAKDYPNLIGPDERIDTMAVAGVLAVQNLAKTDDRFRRVLRFAQYLSVRWDKLRERPFHPGWRDVSQTATLPGWTRFSPSEVFRQFILWREHQYSHRVQ